jgi:serine/threonine protein kinase
LFDEDPEEDGEHRTVVDSSFWSQPEVPRYPTLATFGRFEILGRLARGGMAEVFLAREPQGDGTDRHVVVKRVLPETEGNPELLSMFLEEGATAVRLYHTNVCHVYECGEIDGTAFMALEWVYGPSLHEVVRRAAGVGRGLPWPVAVDIVAQVAGALSYVHQARGVHGRPLNIVHRDVSPHNIMLSWTGQVKLLDFGIAKTTAEGTERTAGKYDYMSPEQAQSRPVDARSDIFALGVVLYEVLVGRALYDRPTLLDTLSAIVREPPPSLRPARPELPEALEHILQRALAKDPAQRFQTAGEMRAALKQVLRAAGQFVTDRRVAMALDGLFGASERVPLRGESHVMTGSFQALTAHALEQGPEEQITYGTFTHESDRPPAPSVRPAPAATGSSRRTRLLLAGGVALLLLLVLAAAAAGAFAALRLLA